MNLKLVDNLDLIDYIAAHRLFRVNQELSKNCMKELITRISIEEIETLIENKVYLLKNIINENKKI